MTNNDLHTRRAQRAARRALQAELATFSTEAELLELHAILNRADPTASQAVRDLLDARHAA